MAFHHKDLARGRWASLSFMEQMAHIGSEVERALNWKKKGNQPYTDMAFERALELIDLTLDCVKGATRLRELTRVREAAADFFTGTNGFRLTAASWRRYFFPFIFAARRQH